MNTNITRHIGRRLNFTDLNNRISKDVRTKVSNFSGDRNLSSKEKYFEATLDIARNHFNEECDPSTGKWITKCLDAKTEANLPLNDEDSRPIHQLALNTSRWFGTRSLPRGFQKALAIGFIMEKGSDAFRLDGVFDIGKFKQEIRNSKDLLDDVKDEVINSLENKNFQNIRLDNNTLEVTFGNNEYRNKLKLYEGAISIIQDFINLQSENLPIDPKELKKIALNEVNYKSCKKIIDKKIKEILRGKQPNIIQLKSYITIGVLLDSACDKGKCSHYKKILEPSSRIDLYVQDLMDNALYHLTPQKYFDIHENNLKQITSIDQLHINENKTSIIGLINHQETDLELSGRDASSGEFRAHNLINAFNEYTQKGGTNLYEFLTEVNKLSPEDFANNREFTYPTSIILSGYLMQYEELSLTNEDKINIFNSTGRSLYLFLQQG